MSIYKVSVQWAMTAELEVEAKDLKAAIKCVNGNALFPSLILNGATQGSPAIYLDDSFIVNEDLTHELNGVQGEFVRPFEWDD